MTEIQVSRLNLVSETIEFEELDENAPETVACPGIADWSDDPVEVVDPTLAILKEWLLVEREQRNIHITDPRQATKKVTRMARKLGLTCVRGLVLPPPIEGYKKLLGCGLCNSFSFGKESDSQGTDILEEPLRVDVPLLVDGTTPRDEWIEGVHLFNDTKDLYTVNPSLREVTSSIWTVGTETFWQEVLAQSITSGPKYLPDLSDGGRARTLKNRFDWSEFTDRCLLYREMETTADLPEIIGMATSLLTINGGETRLKDKLAQHLRWGIGEYQCIISYLIKAIKSYDVQPQDCNSFCSHCDTCSHKLNPLQQVRLKKQQGVRRIRPSEPKWSLSEAEEWLQSSFKMVKREKKHGIFLMICPTALGKTRTYESERGVVVATPTHILARDVLERMRAHGGNVDYIPEVRPIGTEFDQQLRVLYAAGAHQKANELILTEVARIEREEARSPEEQMLVDRHYDIQKLKAGSLDTVVTTHAMLVHLEEIPYDTIIIDEDILSTLLETGTVMLSQMKAIVSVQPLFELVRKAKDGHWTKIPAKLRNPSKNMIQEVLESRSPDGLLSFVTAAGFFKVGDKIWFGRRHGLPKDKKIIIMSATASEEQYRKAFPDQYLRAHSTEDVEQTGRIIQCVERSYSKQCLNELSEPTKKALAKVKEIVGDAVVITYKNYGDVLRDLGFNVHPRLWFRNLRGVDELKGQDVAIIGTPHIPVEEYYLRACLLGFDVGPLVESELSIEPLESGLYEFPFMTFSEGQEVLRKIQVHEILSELIQAVGRARTLRRDCTVFIFSNMPIPGAEIRTLKSLVREFARKEPDPVHGDNLEDAA